MSSPNHKALEERWRLRLRDAQIRLESARTYVKQVRQDLESLPSPDGHFSYRKALQDEALALAEYQRVLHIFADLVMRGVIPEEEG
jgi:hypothetical protein